jgi:periplasmic protein TonB
LGSGSKTTGAGVAPGIWGAGVAFILHGSLAVGMSSVHPSAWAHRPPATVEMDVVEKSPPPPPPQTKKPPEPPPPPPKRIVHRVIAKAPAPPATPPPPNQDPPPEPPPDPSPPVFGVTLDSTVTGDSSIAVPVGNTTMTADRSRRKPGPPSPAVAGPPEFAPAAEASIGEYPRKTKEVTADFPGEARRLGVEGQVVMRVGIDRHGSIRSVKIIKRAGYGFDEAAMAAMWKFKFSPAKTKDGQSVDFLITYTYTFRDQR